MIADESQKITFVNPALARILGVSAADILGHQPAEFMDDAARVSMLGEIEPGNADHAHTYEQAKFPEDGTPLQARVSLWPTFDRGRRLSGCVRIVSDLSELKCMQAMRDHLARIVESSKHGIIGSDSNGIVTSWNKGAEEIYGYTSAEIVGRNIGFLASADAPDEVAQLSSRIRDGEQVAHYETDGITKAGRRIDVSVTLSRAADNAETVPGTWTLVEDITERKHAMRERDLGAAVYSAIQRVSIDGILLVDSHDQIVSFNQRFAEIWHVPLGLLAMRADGPVLEAVAEQVADREAFIARVLELYAHKDQTSCDEIRLKDDRTLDRYSAPVTLEDGTYVGRVWFFRDVTERKRADDKRREEASYFRALVEQQIDGIFIISIDGTIAYVNPRFTELLGYRPDEVIGRPFLDVVADSDRLTVSEAFTEHLLGGPLTTQTHTAIKRKDGGLVDVIAHASRALYEGKSALIGIVIDITERKRAADLLQASEERFRLLVEQAPDAIAVYDLDTGRFVNANNSATLLFGCSRDELFKLGPSHFFAPELAEGHTDGIGFDERSSQALAGVEGVFERHFRNAEGREVTCEIRLIRLPTAAGRLIRGSFIDITERRQAELALRDSQERLRTVFDSVSDAIVVYDMAAGAIIDANPRAFEMFGYTRDEMTKLDLRVLLTDASPYTLQEAAPLVLSAASGAALTIEWSCKAKDGHSFWIEVSLRKTQFSGRDILLATARDITDRKRIDEHIIYMARHDSLTGLANRAVFVDALHQETERAKRGAESFAVLYLDLDHFKDVNDTLGHPVGDLLLCSLAERLRITIRGTDTVARFGGDEFALIQAGISEPLDAAALADKVLKSISAPFNIQGKEIRSGASIGIAIFGPDAPNAETLLSQADVALYRAKAEGRGTYRFFTDDMDAEVNTRVKLAAELREAMTAGQLSLVYQPQIDVDTGRIIGVEALARWCHPTRGLVLPDVFIPIAEHSGLIVVLGRWALQDACRQMKEWIDADIAPPLIAVNVSGLQFKTPLELETEIAAILTQTALPPQRLELELTESVLMDVSRDNHDLLQRLRRAGHRVAIDDFGTGYSSLKYLARFPVDRIKIAQGFIVDLTSTSSNQVIVKAAIGLAHDLNLDIVVEGVETAEQLKLVRSWGCRKVQGHYFSKPLPANELTALLRIGKISPAQSLSAKASAVSAA
jgi:diguanylate cyclase (GGDEF)-like protein/PAS domain S-box-containing protein